MYQRLDVAIGELRERLGGLPSPAEAEGIWTGIWYEEAHHSTALEGNTLVLKQVEALLADGRAVGDKELREYLEVQGYADAAKWVYGQALEPGAWSADRLITLTEVRHVHRIALAPAWDLVAPPDAGPTETPGNFREHDIHPFPAGMTPPSWVEVPAAMADWVTDTQALGDASSPIETIADLHGRFERVHPFLDGNGRAGRLLVNLALVRLGYPPVIIYKRERTRYLNALRRADTGDHGALGEILARAVLDNLYRFVVPAVAGPYRLVPLAALATAELNVGALRTAANRGRLQAQRNSDGQWRSTKHWVNEYAAVRYQRG